MPAPAIARHVNPADETIRVGPLGVHFLVTGAESNGSLAAFELVVPARERLLAPPHSHDHYEETIYGIEGVLTWTVDGTPIDVGPGQALCIPRGAVHRFDNTGGARREGVVRDLAGGDRTGVLPRDGCGHQRGGNGRRGAGQGHARRDHAPPRPDARPAPARASVLNPAS